MPASATTTKHNLTSRGLGSNASVAAIEDPVAKEARVAGEIAALISGGGLAHFKIALASLLHKHFPIPAFAEPSQIDAAAKDLHALIPQEEKVGLEAVRSILVGEYGDPTAKDTNPNQSMPKTNSNSKPIQTTVRIRIAAIPLTATVKLPTNTPYEQEMASLTQVLLQPEDMVYETDVREGETVFTAYQRAAAEIGALLVSNMFKLREDILATHAKSEREIAQLAQLMAQDDSDL